MDKIQFVSDRRHPDDRSTIPRQRWPQVKRVHADLYQSDLRVKLDIFRSDRTLSMIAGSTVDHSLDLAIVGGGIGGLCLAIGLAKHAHIDVQIYEGAHTFAEVGAGLTVGPNARRALKLLDPTIEQAFSQQRTGNGPGFPAQKDVYHRFVWGAGPKSGQTITNVWCEDGQQSVHRARFLDALAKLVKPEITHFNKQLSRMEERPDGRTTLHFADGTAETVDCVIGADGVHSTVRKHMVPAGHPGYHPTFSKSAAYRGLIPMQVARAVLDDEFTQIATLHSAKGGMIMTYPVDSHTLLNVVAADTEVTEWKGESAQPADLESMKQKYSTWGPIARSIVGLLDRPETKIWSLWNMSPLPSFIHSSIALMGDAAHATTPYQGQGAGQAIEDALVLSNLIGSVRNPQDLQYALQAYDYVRRPRAQKVVKTSREAGDLFSLQLPSVLDDEVLFRQNVEHRFDWIFDQDMQLQVDQSFVIMKELRVAAQTR